VQERQEQSLTVDHQEREVLHQFQDQVQGVYFPWQAEAQLPFREAGFKDHCVQIQRVQVAQQLFQEQF
tara:strand:- start:310 stop:513 length:204 start_codon:yes stop_codon:yes gene_type:complete